MSSCSGLNDQLASALRLGYQQMHALVDQQKIEIKKH